MNNINEEEISKVKGLKELKEVFGFHFNLSFNNYEIYY